jgi:hypothetical protein
MLIIGNKKWNHWTELKIVFPDPKIEIVYFQQTSHPFLAEYNRKIIFKTDKGQTDTIKMSDNTGGRTLFNLYFQTNENKRMIILEDHFGFYYFDLITKKYAESTSIDKMNGDNNSKMLYLGRIDSESFPLKFVDGKDEAERKITHN